MKYLFCIDGSERSFYAMEKALNFVVKPDAVTLLYVIHPQMELYEHYERLRKEELADIERLLGDTNTEKYIKDMFARVQSILNSKQILYDNLILTGDPASEIISELNTDKYDLVVIGSRGLSGLSDFFLGSVSKKVVEHSPLPVLVIKN